MSTALPPGEYRAVNGTFYRIVGHGEPLLLLHGLLASGAMFDPLIALLKDDFRMLVPDLRGHGRSGELSAPYSVDQMAADLDAVTAEGGFSRGIVLGYSHGGAVAQQFAHNHPDAVSKLVLACTYACNVASLCERVEAWVLVALLYLVSPRTIARLMIAKETSSSSHTALTTAQGEWLRDILGANRTSNMRDAARGLLTFNSRPWLNAIKVPTLVVGGSADDAVPRHHFDELTRGIRGSTGRLINGAGHTLLWTHTAEFADVIRELKHSPVQ